MSEEHKVIVAAEAGISIRSVQDVGDAIGACLTAQGLVLTESELGPGFFDLRTGLAGELFQQCVKYRIRMAIVLPSPEAHGERFGELAREHRRHEVVRFVGSREEADAWLRD